MQRFIMTIGLTCVVIGGAAWLAKTTVTAADKADVALRILDWKETQALIAAKKGRIVVVDAWSTSCVPCIKEFPNLVALHNARQKDVACISLNLDYIGLKKKPPKFYHKRVNEFLTKQQAAFDNVLCSEESEAMFEKLGVPSIPAVFVYDRTGKLVKTFDNSEAETEEEAFTYQDVNAFLDELLK